MSPAGRWGRTASTDTPGGDAGGARNPKGQKLGTLAEFDSNLKPGIKKVRRRAYLSQ